MKNPVFDQIIRAIDGHHVLEITDEAGVRVVEPYLVFESADGDMLLHGWQRAGAFRHTPPPRWCNLHVNDIAAVELRPEHFTQPHSDYNPASTQFHRVLYAIQPMRTAVQESKSHRTPMKRARHRPPTRTAHLRR